MLKVRRMRGIVFALALALALTALAGCTKKSGATTTNSGSTSTATTAPKYKLVKDGTLTVGSDTAFPPFEAMNGSTAEGFDVDLAKAIADKLGLKLNYTTQKFDTLIPQLKAGGTFDVIMSAMTITEARQKEISFSTPYIDSNQSIAVTKGKFAKLNGNDTAAIDKAFAGKIIGVQSGTTGEAWAKENLKSAAQVVPFDDTLAAFSALQAGKVDAIVNDLPVSAYVVKDATRNAEIIAEIPTGEQYGIGIAKDNTELKKAIDQALADLKSSGKYAEIYQKWFGVAPSK